nr:MAG TPA: hypothetical protein [Caudoviricetes sp.]
MEDILKIISTFMLILHLVLMFQLQETINLIKICHLLSQFSAGKELLKQFFSIYKLINMGTYCCGTSSYQYLKQKWYDYGYQPYLQ